ncbi:TlpA family protein disulfide reductase [Rhodococcoides navarretei]|uniref:TlpA disulfide reductase family protein n=1 Tax=Rhodococcus navarretei TaxID=3128981 RepID=A0ABU9D110_9NOCA
MRGSGTVVMLVLMVAMIAALWPRSGGIERGPSEAIADNAAPVVSEPARSRPPGDAARATALPLCPPPVPREGGPLAGVIARCIGSDSDSDADLADVLGSEVTLINLWASWCGPCRTEMPVVDAYAAEPDAIPVIGIDVEDRPADAAALVTQLGVRYPNYIDGGSVLDALSAPPVLPLSFLLRPDGTIERVTDPTVFEMTDQIRTAVKDFTS